jgi:outer membrane protein OmpA-like peptidoglycan-associated protein
LGPEKAVLSPLVTNDNLSLSGILLTGENQKKALANQKVSIKNELGQIVATVTTDENGNFSFNNLPIDKNYTFSIDDSDLPANTKITLRNKSGKEVKISSNSAGGKYNFQLLGVDKTSMSDLVNNDNLTLSGKLLLGDDQKSALANKKVSIKNELGQIVATVTTDENGNFSFNNLPIDKNYTFSIDDIDLPENTKITLKNKSGKQVEIITTTIGGKYNFELLGVNKTSMSDLANNEDVSLSGVLLSGDKQKKVIANAKVSIKNELGEIIATVVTDENGNFSFQNIPLDKNYTFSFDDTNLPANTKITLRNKNGNEVKIASNNSGGTFNFSLIGIEKTSMSDLLIEDKDLLMSVNGYLYGQNKKAISMAKVTIFNKNEVIENIITDNGGHFTIQNLGADKNYLFLLDDADSRFADVTKIYVADSKGRIYKEVNRNTSGKFQFELLEVDRTALGNYLPEDVLSLTLKNKVKQTTVVAKKDNENKTADNTKAVVNEKKVVNNAKVKKQKVVVLDSAMYYSYGLYEADSNGKNILDKVVSILNSNPNLFLELTAHTDSRSSAAFNMTLSKKRADAAITYIISKGIDKSRLKGIGVGETKLLNNCKNDADCSEEEHAKNRRTEIKIIEVITL